jgi:thiamine pyrophosphate-dependent acetolactate synthase large subunit-like protein
MNDSTPRTAAPAEDSSTLDRRTFLKGTAAAAGAAVTAATALAQAAEAVKPATNKLPSEVFITNPGSDFMADVIKSTGMKYVAMNPAAGFRSLQESIINYLGNKNPEILTCLHEETAAGMAHGYAKACGELMGVMLHGTVGLQHATMGIYNAWCDRAPMVVFAGNGLRADTRRPGVEWNHSVQDPGDIVRDYIKWDDQPISLQHFAESTVRACQYALTAPAAPVMVTTDMDIQEEDNHHAPGTLRIPKMPRIVHPAGDTSVVAEAARLLAGSQKPVIIADRAVRNQDGVKLMVELAETLGAPVIDNGQRMNFPNMHDLDCSFQRQTLLRDADVILMLEVGDPWGNTHSFADPYKTYRRAIRPDAKVITIGMREVYLKSNFQDFQRYLPADLPIGGDVQATLPDLIAAIKRSGINSGTVSQRRAAYKKVHDDMRARDKQNATLGWDASPISTARLAAETWQVIKNEKWSLVTSDRIAWARRLWPVTEYHQMLGGSGGQGQGYYMAASVGAALANRDRGILSVNFQPDGDAMYAPGSLWTAAYHKIPMLIVMHNNRCYHQEIMHVARMAAQHNRPQNTARIGTEITNPNIDFAKLAQSMGVWAEGPVTDPNQLGPALQRAIKVVKSGVPALVDAVCQGR